MRIAALPCGRDPDASLFPRCAQGRGACSFATCWRTVCDDATLGRFRLHDLRHNAASQALMSGENLTPVGKLPGRRLHRTTAGDPRLADAHLVEAAEKAGSIVTEAMASARENRFDVGTQPFPDSPAPISAVDN